MYKRKIHLAANWKMNHTLTTVESYASSFIKAFEHSVESVCSAVDITLAVPSLFVTETKKIFAHYGINIAVQNAHFEEKGAFTGEISTLMLKDAGINHVIVGHSERRTLFHENQEIVHKKLRAALKQNLSVILCLGESKEERLSNQTNHILEQQLSSALLDIRSLDNVVIAYEPVWAIGTGLTASPDQAQEAHAYIRDFIKEKYGKAQSESTQILYGGSMKPEVTKELLAMEDVDGGLVGGASLDPQSFAKMIQIAYEFSKN